jgi:hypothetical protein
MNDRLAHSIKTNGSCPKSSTATQTLRSLKILSGPTIQKHVKAIASHSLPLFYAQGISAINKIRNSRIV